MSRKHLIGAALMLSLAGTASATSFVVTTDAVVGAVAASTDATSDVSSSFRDDKIVQAARDDAASFVGSQGAIRGAKREVKIVRTAARRTDGPEIVRARTKNTRPQQQTRQQTVQRKA